MPWLRGRLKFFGPAALAAVQAHGVILLLVGTAVTLVPSIIGTLFAHRVLLMDPIICGALAGAKTVDAAVAGACEVAHSQTPILVLRCLMPSPPCF